MELNRHHSTLVNQSASIGQSDWSLVIPMLPGIEKRSFVFAPIGNALDCQLKEIKELLHGLRGPPSL